MGDHATDFVGSIDDAIRDAIAKAIADSTVLVSGGGGHYTISVVSPVFAGKGSLASQRLVYAAIGHLMTGDRAPVHAVDSLKTRAP
jgi:acid stress-induced BolA-like protein IbaG/YrbA